MTATTITTPCDTALQTVWSANRDYLSAIEASKVSDADALNILMAAVYIAGKQDFFLTANRPWFIAALEARGIKVPTKGKKQNGWLKVIYLALGSWTTDDAGEKVWDKGDSTLFRYARSLRHMNHVGIDPAKALDYIRTFPGGLTGMADEDRKINPPDPRKPSGVTKEDVARAKSVSPMAVVTVEQPAEVGDTGFGRAFGYWKGSEFCILGFEENSGATAQKLAIKRAKGATNSRGQTAAQQEAEKAFAMLDI